MIRHEVARVKMEFISMKKYQIKQILYVLINLPSRVFKWGNSATRFSTRTAVDGT